MVKLGIMGAGAIGCYVGGRLLASGVDVTLVARQSLAGELARHGLHLTDLNGAKIDVAPEKAAAAVATSAAALSACDAVIVTVKGGDTAAAAAALSPVLRPDARVISLQNGVNNPAVLRAALSQAVLAAMVPFNVLRKGDGCFHQGTEGTIAVGPGADDVVTALVAAGIPAATRADIEAVQWGKLVVNLNNVVNALAGVPIRTMILDAGYRRVMSAMLQEAVEVLAAAGIRPRLDPPLPPALVPKLLRLPTWLFRVAARPMVRVDPQARSSMWDDLERGRKTEIDALNGEVVTLAAKIGRAAPINAALVALVKAAEGKRSPQMSARALQDVIAAPAL